MNATEPRLLVCANPDDLASRAADRIIAAGETAIRERGRFTLALAGGSTPEKLYSLLAHPDRASLIDWSKVCLFMGDERFVPLDDPRSNYGMAKRSLLAHVPVPEQQVFPVAVDAPDAAAAAADYAATLTGAFGLAAGQWPRFDVVLLGLGDDAHTASLFPGKAALHEKTALVVASPPGVLPPPVDRVTCTFGVFNAARLVLFLVAGANKAEVLRQVLRGADLDMRPASMIRPANGELVWMCDEAAAQRLA